MKHDVFVSHSAQDKTVADAVCHALEQAGVRCWVAPRDIQPGQSWAGSIVGAISRSRMMVLIYSSNSNRSGQVLREVERAASKGIAILPFRIEEVVPSEDLEYFLSTPHWLDALTPPLEEHLRRLADAVAVYLGRQTVTAPPSPGVGEASSRTVTGATPPQLQRRNSGPSRADGTSASHAVWTDDSIYISYAAEDFDLARRLAEEVRAAGLPVWFDQPRLGAWDDYREEIRNRIRAASAFVPLLSASALTRGERIFYLEWYVAKERELCLPAWPGFVVPVHVGEVHADSPFLSAFGHLEIISLPRGGEFSQVVQRLWEIHRERMRLAQHE